MKGEFYKMDYEAWDEGTDALSLELEAAYLRLCHQLYRRKAAIPSAPATLARIWRCHPNKARKLLGDLIAAGKVDEIGGHLTNTRVTRELDDRETMRRQKADAGKTGGTRTQDNRRNSLEDNDEQQAPASSPAKQNQAEREVEVELKVEKKDNPQDPNGSLAPKGATTRGHRLPLDFASDPRAIETCQEWGYVGANAENLLAEFCDHWSNEPGAKGVKLDWIKTLRNRLRQVGPYRQGRVIKGPFPARPSQADVRADAMDALKYGGQHVSSLNDQRDFDLGPVIEHQGDGRPDRDVPRAIGGGAGRFSQEGFRRHASPERR